MHQCGFGPGAQRTLDSPQFTCNSSALNSPTSAIYRGSNDLLIPLVGGSSGGTYAIGVPTQTQKGGGGGGGGAMLVASTSRVLLTGTITAIGLTVAPNESRGSGGAIRIVAPIVSGTGSINVGIQSPGKKRIDTLDRSTLGLASSGTIGSYMSTGLEFQRTKIEILQIGDVVVPSNAGNVSIPINLSGSLNTNGEYTVPLRFRVARCVGSIDLFLGCNGGFFCNVIRISVNVNASSDSFVEYTTPFFFSDVNPKTYTVAAEGRCSTF